MTWDPDFPPPNVIKAAETVRKWAEQRGFTNQWQINGVQAHPSPEQCFQSQVREWTTECFGTEAAMHVVDRSHRFTEEALELAQATGTTREDAHKLVDYVYDRPTGEVSNEVGGVLLTTAALCTALGINLWRCARNILPYAWSNVKRIKAKRASKTSADCPLPGASELPVEPHVPALPTYHDVVVHLNGRKYSMFDGYRYRLVCQHITGWEFQMRRDNPFDNGQPLVQWEAIGGEYYDNDFTVEVNGRIICSATKKEGP